MLADILGGKVGESYYFLGHAFGSKEKIKGVLNGVMEKCQKKLTNWKMQHLCLGVRFDTP